MVWIALYMTRIEYRLFTGGLRGIPGVRHVKAINNASNVPIVDVDPGCKVKYLASRIELFIDQVLQGVKQGRIQMKQIKKRKRRRKLRIKRGKTKPDRKHMTLTTTSATSSSSSSSLIPFKLSMESFFRWREVYHPPYVEKYCSHQTTLDCRFPLCFQSWSFSHPFNGGGQLTADDCLKHAKYLKTFVALCKYPKYFTRVVRKLNIANRKNALYIKESDVSQFSYTEWLLNEVYCLMRMILGKPSRYLPIHLELWTFVEYNLYSLLPACNREYTKINGGDGIMKFYHRPSDESPRAGEYFFMDNIVNTLHTNYVSICRLIDGTNTYKIPDNLVIPIASRRSLRTMLLILKAVPRWLRPSYKRVTTEVNGNGRLDEYYGHHQLSKSVRFV